MALTCVGQAKAKLAPTEDAVQGSGQANSKTNFGTIIVYRQWSFSGAGRPSWRFNVDNGPDLIIRNGIYLRLDVCIGRPGSRPQTHVFARFRPANGPRKSGRNSLFSICWCRISYFRIDGPPSSSGPDGQQNEIRGRSSSPFPALERFVPPPPKAPDWAW
jgi:hypothetical protein